MPNDEGFLEAVKTSKKRLKPVLGQFPFDRPQTYKGNSRGQDRE